MISPNDLANLPHVVVLQTANGVKIFEFEGDGCMRRANDFAVSLAHENRDGTVLVTVRYRRFTGPDVL